MWAVSSRPEGGRVRALKEPGATFPQRCPGCARRLGCSSIPISLGGLPWIWEAAFFFLFQGSLAQLEGKNTAVPLFSLIPG